MKISKFIFGTGNFNFQRQKERINFLSEAVNKGFTHFDTSPLYNYGLSEIDIGNLYKNNKNITVTTKVGIYPPEHSVPSIKNVFFRKLVGKIIPSYSKSLVNYNLDIANKSLERSLKRMNRERIEILLIHDPCLNLLNTEEWKSWFESLKIQGKIINFGATFSKKTEQEIPFKVIQSFDSLFIKEDKNLLYDKKKLRINFGYFFDLKRKNIKFDNREMIRRILKRNLSNPIIINTKDKNKLNLYFTHQKLIEINI